MCARGARSPGKFRKLGCLRMRFEGIKTGSQKRTYKMWILLRTLNFKMGVLQVAQPKIVRLEG